MAPISTGVEGAVVVKSAAAAVKSAAAVMDGAGPPARRAGRRFRIAPQRGQPTPPPPSSPPRRRIFAEGGFPKKGSRANFEGNFRGGRVFAADFADANRAAEKARVCYGGDVSWLGDVCRARVRFPAAGQLLALLEAVGGGRYPAVRLVRVKNLMAGPDGEPRPDGAAVGQRAYDNPYYGTLMVVFDAQLYHYIGRSCA